MVKLHSLKKADAEKILSGVWKDLSKDVVDAFIQTANCSTRTLVKLMGRVHQLMAINNTAELNSEIIATAGDLLMR